MQPAALAGSALPEKRAYGSNHMFIDRGQQRGLAMPDHGNQAAVSGALGGFSTVWGAQIMPFSRATFDRWPFGWDEIEPHYRAVLAEVPLAAEDDDYAEDFPLLSASGPLPPVSARTADVLDRYRRHRDAIRAKGIVVGKARLAFAANSCVRCGLCMTGCPYSLIYSARQTVDRFVSRGRVRHISRVLVTSVDQPVGGTPSVRGIDLAERARGAPRGRPRLRRRRRARQHADRAELAERAAEPGRPAGVHAVPGPVRVAALDRRSARTPGLHPQPVQPAAEGRRRGLHDVSGALLPVQPGDRGRAAGLAPAVVERRRARSGHRRARISAVMAVGPDAGRIAGPAQGAFCPTSRCGSRPTGGRRCSPRCCAG